MLYDTTLLLRTTTALVARIDTTLGEGEVRADFIRKALEAELRRRERAIARERGHAGKGSGG
jgi:hypothetical protein